MKSYTIRERRAIIDRINQLSETEHSEIFKLIKNCDKLNFTHNSNGIFLNFSVVPNSVVETIDSFVTFCLDNKLHLDEYDQKINECKINNNIDIILPNELEAFDMMQPQPLNNVINTAIHKVNVEQEWMKCYKDCKQKEKIENLIDVLESNISRIVKKKTCNMKFSNAKKKYARRVIADKKNDNELVSCLEPEPYKRTR